MPLVAVEMRCGNRLHLGRQYSTVCGSSKIKECRLGDQDSNLSWRSQNPLFYQLNYPPALAKFYHSAWRGHRSLSSFVAFSMR